MAPVTTSVDQHGPIDFQKLAAGADHGVAPAVAAVGAAPVGGGSGAGEGGSLAGATGAMCAGAALVGVATTLARRLTA